MIAQCASGPRPATRPACIGAVAHRDRAPLRRDIENLKAAAMAAGADCGFASGATMVRVDPRIVWAKFRALAEGARLASQQLWG